MENAAGPAATAMHPNVSPDDVATCLKVLSHFERHPDELNSPAFKQLRIVGCKVFYAINSKFFRGRDEHEVVADKQSKRDRRIRDAKKREADKKFVNNTLLRSQRLEELQRLTEAPADHQQLLEAPQPPHEPGDDHADADRADGVHPNVALPASPSPEAPVAPDPEPELYHARSCYVCKARYYKLHHFYDNQCPDCAVISFEKRLQSADCRGRIVVLTGARIKIGYHIGLKLLRAGATVIATTRFPRDAALRYSKEPDFAEFGSRLKVVGLDLRNLSSVEEFVAWLAASYPHLDMLINNAAQSVRKPPAFYAHLMPTETAPVAALPPSVHPLLVPPAAVARRAALATLVSESPSESYVEGSTADEHHATQLHTLSCPEITPAVASQVPLLDGDATYDFASFPVGRLDVHAQQVDLRHSNSWLFKLNEVPTLEMVETTVINAMAPFILNSKLKPMLMRSPFKSRFIINVSAMEGKFYRHKTPHHPHTNAAKAALNMITRTSSDDYAKDGVYMNSVDTGWVTDENPYQRATAYSERTNFMAPLDEIEGAARVLDPIFTGLSGGPLFFGKFFKDYRESEW